MNTFFSIFAFVGFFCSVLVHFATYFGINLSENMPWVWLLHVGIFIAIIPLIKKDLWRDLFQRLPLWAKTLVVVLGVYAIFNFLLFLALSQGGSPQVRDGAYVLASHGTVIRELSEAEYRAQERYALRGVSGHWMIFYILPALFSWYRKDAR